MQLTPDQLLQFGAFAQAAVLVKDETDFRVLVAEHVQPLLPHDIMIGIVGQLNFDHLIVHRHIAINYPDIAKDHVTQPVNIRERPLLQRWLHTRAPVIACPLKDRSMMSDREIFEAEVFQLGQLAIHGLPDLTNRMGSYLSFARVPADKAKAELETLLSIMTPLLHVALVRATQANGQWRGKTRDLTAIEQDLLMWLAAGRSNEEMAQLRHRSPATIRNQLAKLYEKLGVSSRTEAVALALSEALNVPQPHLE